MTWLWQVPLLVVTFWIWLQAPPDSLVDASRRETLRRRLMPASTRRLTNEDVERFVEPPSANFAGAAGTAAGDAGRTREDGVAAPPVTEAPAKGEELHDEAWWRGRMTQAREALERDQLLADALQSRVNALTTDESARDDPAERRELSNQRDRTLAELKRMTGQIAADRKAIADLEEDARRQNVPAGWVR